MIHILDHEEYLRACLKIAFRQVRKYSVEELEEKRKEKKKEWADLRRGYI